MLTTFKQFQKRGYPSPAAPAAKAAPCAHRYEILDKFADNPSPEPEDEQHIVMICLRCLDSRLITIDRDCYVTITPNVRKAPEDAPTPCNP